MVQINEEIEGSATNYVLLQELTDKKEKVEAELEKTMDRWVYLNDLAEKIEAKRK
jgi:ATP-binding cassette subfamily F protein uup